jgi:hypothetical protein
MPNLDPWMNQQSEEESLKPSKFENHLLSIRDDRQTMIHPNSHPTYNERHQKNIEMIDWVLEKYKMASNSKKINEQNKQGIINNIIEELDRKRDIAIHKKKQNLFKDDVSMYRLEEDTINYVLFIICEGTGKLY